MCKPNFLAALAVLLCATVGGCDKKKGESNNATDIAATANLPRTQLASDSVEREPVSSDQAWAALVANENRPERKDGESNFEYFMRDVELSNQRRRQLGLEFWRQFPDDPRRYEWLQLAVHLAPHYPLNMDEWIGLQADLRPNSAAVDDDALQEWERLYPQLRDEFLASDTMSDQQRRYLLFGELEQRIRRYERDGARGGSVDAETLAKDVIRYFEYFSRAFSELDRDTGYAAQTKVLFDGIMENAATFGLNEVQQIDFVDSARMTGDDLASVLTSRISPQVPINIAAATTLTDTTMRREQDLYSFLNFFQYLQPSTREERLVFEYKKAVNYRRFREFAVNRAWDESLDPAQKISRLLRTAHGTSIYLDNISASIYKLADSEDLVDIPIDHTAETEWNELYEERTAEIWEDERTTLDQRGQLRANRLYHNFWWDSRLAYGHSDQEARVHAMLEGIYELHDVYNSDDWPYDYARKMAAEITRGPQDWGLNDDDLQAFFEPMLEYEPGGLRDIAEGWFRSYELRTTPLVLGGRTLDGGELQIADLRGKIVLLDYWTTTCASCIAAMPSVHAIYEKYQDQGFEVVSVCFDAERNRSKVERIKEEMGLNWPTIVADDQWRELNEQFGFGNIVPQYMLLDREGRKVAGTPEIDLGRKLEMLLDEMLAAEEGEKEAAIVR